MGIYLDYAATTPVDKEVYEAMRPYFCEHFGNANSVHALGRECAKAVDDSRRKVAAALNAKKSEIFFTSGGTESNNWAIKSILHAKARRRILISAIEHPSVLESAMQMKARGYAVEKIRVGSDGLVDIDRLKKQLSGDVALVSVMYVNNETGAIQPVREIARLAHDCGSLFHCDCVQAMSSERIDVLDLGADYVSLSAHKIYGPKGIGCLYIKESVDCDRLIAGGHQERGLRGGTSNTPLIVGFAEAAIQAEKRRKADNAHINEVKARFIGDIMSDIIDVSPNAKSDSCVPGILNLYFPRVQNELLMQKLDLEGISCSAGAACSAGSVTASHVLSAMGHDEERANCSLRFSFGRMTTVGDAATAAKAIIRAVKTLRPKN